MGRAPCCEKVGLKRGRWTAEEDEILSNYIQAKGEGSWRSLPKNAGLLRCGKSCRLRWINYLRADLKRGNFTRDEEELIIKLHQSLGNRWSLIASHLQGRTDNEIKNYWNSHLRRKIYSFRKTLSQSLPVIMDPAKADIAKRKGGRTSKKTTTMEGNKSCSITTSTENDYDGSSNKTDHNVSIDETVLLPSTPLLEKETRSGGDQDSMPCPMGSVEEEDLDDILATLESIESSGLLCFDDIMVDDESLLGNVDTNVQAELGSDKVTVNVGDESGDSGDLDSWFSTASCIIDDYYKLDNLDWDWENVVEWNDNMDCNNNINMPSWVWEDNDELASHA